MRKARHYLCTKTACDQRDTCAHAIAHRCKRGDCTTPSETCGGVCEPIPRDFEPIIKILHTKNRLLAAELERENEGANKLYREGYRLLDRLTKARRERDELKARLENGLTLFRINNDPDEGAHISGKCAGCGWSALFVYWMSDTAENAAQEIDAERRGDGSGTAGLCGDCMSDLLSDAEGKSATTYKIIATKKQQEPPK